MTERWVRAVTDYFSNAIYKERHIIYAKTLHKFKEMWARRQVVLCMIAIPCPRFMYVWSSLCYWPVIPVPDENLSVSLSDVWSRTNSNISNWQFRPTDTKSSHFMMLNSLQNPLHSRRSSKTMNMTILHLNIQQLWLIFLMAVSGWTVNNILLELRLC